VTMTTNTVFLIAAAACFAVGVVLWAWGTLR
jgi:hypothetical protein